MFEGVTGSGFKSDIALDDISVITGPCLPSKLCDFEVDRCGYEVMPGYPLQWYRDHNGTSSLSTGPSLDHTTASGKGQSTIYLHDLLLCFVH